MAVTQVLPGSWKACFVLGSTKSWWALSQRPRWDGWMQRVYVKLSLLSWHWVPLEYLWSSCGNLQNLVPISFSSEDILPGGQIYFAFIRSMEEAGTMKGWMRCWWTCRAANHQRMPTTPGCQRLHTAEAFAQLQSRFENMAGYHGWISWPWMLQFSLMMILWPFPSGESGARVWMSDTLLASHLGLWKPRWGKIVGWWSSEVSSKNRHALAQMIQVLGLRSGIEFWRKLP